MTTGGQELARGTGHHTDTLVSNGDHIEMGGGEGRPLNTARRKHGGADELKQWREPLSSLHPLLHFLLLFEISLEKLSMQRYVPPGWRSGRRMDGTYVYD